MNLLCWVGFGTLATPLLHVPTTWHHGSVAFYGSTQHFVKTAVLIKLHWAQNWNQWDPGLKLNRTENWSHISPKFKGCLGYGVLVLTMAGRVKEGGIHWLTWPNSTIYLDLKEEMQFGITAQWIRGKQKDPGNKGVYSLLSLIVHHSMVIMKKEMLPQCMKPTLKSFKGLIPHISALREWFLLFILIFTLCLSSLVCWHLARISELVSMVSYFHFLSFFA